MILSLVYLSTGTNLEYLCDVQIRNTTAVAPVVSVVDDQLLLAIGGIFGMIEIQHDHCRRVDIVGDKLLDERHREPINILPGGGVLQAGQGRCASQVGS